MRPSAPLAFVTFKPWDERTGPQSSAQAIAGPDALAEVLAQSLQAGDMVVCLGAGNSTEWAHALPQWLAGEPLRAVGIAGVIDLDDLPDARHTCALDIADRAGTSLDAIGQIYRVTRERITGSQPSFAKLRDLLELHNAELVHVLGSKPLALQPMLDDALRAAEQLKPLMADVGYKLFNAHQAGQNLLFEGAQGTMLDIDHGTYPFVTSSNTVAAQAMIRTMDLNMVLVLLGAEGRCRSHEQAGHQRYGGVHPCNFKQLSHGRRDMWPAGGPPPVRRWATRAAHSPGTGRIGMQILTSSAPNGLSGLETGYTPLLPVERHS